MLKGNDRINEIKIFRRFANRRGIFFDQPSERDVTGN